VDGGFQAGAVKEDVGEVDWLFQARIKGADAAGSCEQGGEPGVDDSQVGFVEPMGETVTAAFGEGFDAIDAADQEEPLQEMALGDAHAELAVLGADEMTGDIATLGEDGGAAEFVDLLWRMSTGIKSALFHGKGDEFGFQPRGREDFIDADEQIALPLIILTGGNERKRWTKFGLVSYDFHGSRAIGLVW
jgi:hypothetical protein